MISYDEVVKMIKESNEKVDEVLKAARLERHERQPMSYERYKFTIFYCWNDCYDYGLCSSLHGYLLYGNVERGYLYE